MGSKSIKYDENSDTEYCLNIYLEYPAYLARSHNELPFLTRGNDSRQV